jgi:opacity protein-like surface antigen
MKHIIVLISILFTLLSAQVFDRGPTIQHKISFGLYSPPEIESGLTIGYGYYRYIDDMVSAGVGIDAFWTNYMKVSSVETEETGLGQEIITQQVEIDMTSYLLPLMGTVRVILPFELGAFSPYTNVSLGWNILFNNETNYVNGEQTFRFFNGFGWGLGAGASLVLGEKSSIGIETYYRSAKMKANVDETELGLPIYDELDMTGLGLQIGLFMNI